MAIIHCVQVILIVWYRKNKLKNLIEIGDIRSFQTIFRSDIIRKNKTLNKRHAIVTRISHWKKLEDFRIS